MEGAEEKGGRSLQRRVLSFSSGPLGQTARPLPAPLPGALFVPTLRRPSPWLGPLAPRSLLLPATPLLSPASPAPLSLPFISPTSVFPVGGSALLPSS